MTATGSLWEQLGRILVGSGLSLSPVAERGNRIERFRPIRAFRRTPFRGLQAAASEEGQDTSAPPLAAFMRNVFRRRGSAPC